jgi:hypothetical protein
MCDPDLLERTRVVIDVALSGDERIAVALGSEKQAVIACHAANTVCWTTVRDR